MNFTNRNKDRVIIFLYILMVKTINYNKFTNYFSIDYYWSNNV